MTTPITTTTTTTTRRVHRGQEQLPMRQEPFFPRASEKELYAEMERCAMLLRIETQEYNRALPSPSSSAASLSEAHCTGTHNARAQELYGAMVQLANHLEQVTHDLHHLHHHHRRHLANATTSSASLAPTKKKTIKKKEASSARRRCEHCGQTSSAAWRRGPDYCLLCNVCGLQYKAKQNIPRSMSVRALLN